MNWHYLIWIPIVIIWYAVYAYVSKLSNDTKSTTSLIYVFILGLCPLWAIVTRISKNLIFDGMLYDIVLTLTFTITLIFLGGGKAFSNFNWMGLFLVILGFIFMKI